MRLAAGIACAILCPWMAGTVHAQGRQASLLFAVGVPQGDFRENLSSNGYGLDVDFLFPLGPGPLLVGGGGGFLVYGSESRREPFIPAIPEVTIKVTTANWIVTGYFMVRVQTGAGRVRPYVDGLVGVNYLVTDTSVSGTRGLGTPFATSTILDDAAVSYGVDAGVQWDVNPDGRRVAIDVRVRYAWGGTAEYLKEGSIQRVEDRLQFDPLSSRTDLLAVHAGVTARF